MLLLNLTMVFQSILYLEAESPGFKALSGKAKFISKGSKASGNPAFPTLKD